MAIVLHLLDDVYNEWHVLGLWSMCERMRPVWKSMDIQMDWLLLKVENATDWLLMWMRKPLRCTSLSTEPISAGSLRKLELIFWCFFFSGGVTGDKRSITSKLRQRNLGAACRLSGFVGTDNFLQNSRHQSKI